MIRCTNCGSEVGAENSFCTGCGQRIAILPRPVNPADPARDNFIAKNGGRAAGIIVLVGFVLPWINCAGDSTGLELASRPTNGCLWVVPISVIIALVVQMARTSTFQQMKIAAAAMAFAGLASVLSMLYFYVDLLR